MFLSSKPVAAPSGSTGANVPVVVNPPEQDGCTCTNLIPLSYLELDLPAPADWSAFLAAREIEITIDDVGRAAITRPDARRLFDEHREHEAKARERAAEVERAAVEADRLRRAQIYKGVPADAVPVGVTPSAAMLQAAHDAQPRRTSLLEEAFSNPGQTTIHSLPRPDEGDW
jgi:hypothetical protein